MEEFTRKERSVAPPFTGNECPGAFLRVNAGENDPPWSSAIDGVVYVVLKLVQFKLVGEGGKLPIPMEGEVG